MLIMDDFLEFEKEKIICPKCKYRVQINVHQKNVYEFVCPKCNCVLLRKVKPST